MKKTTVIFVAIGMLLVFTTMLFAADSASIDQDGYQVEEQPALPIADMSINASQIIWEPHVKSAGLVLTISGSNGMYLRQEFADGVQLTLDVSDKRGVLLPDGGYNYELYSIPLVSRQTQRTMDAARERGDTAAIAALLETGAIPESLTQSGHFTIDGSVFVLPVASENTAGIDAETHDIGTNGQNAVPMVPSDQVILDDLIVDGSICAGQDCVNGESFGFDTIRVKENNLRIKFQDTSSTSSFPSNDWQLTANDSANGGANKFSIDDIDGGRTPFTLEAGAPSHSLYVDDGGRVGLGTSTPVVEAHIVDGDSPTVRLEQNGSSGFTPQTWDIAGNETNFFVRDATNGSTLPFRIRPGAPSSSIYIDTDGDVGLGTASPSARLDVVGDAEINGPLTVINGDVGLGTASPSARLDVVGDAEINGSLAVVNNDGTSEFSVTENSATSAGRTLLRLQNNGSSTLRFTNTDSSHAATWALANSNSGFHISLVGTSGTEFKVSAAGEVTMGPGGNQHFLLDASGNLDIAGTLTTSGPSCSGGCLRQGELTEMDEIDLLKKVNQLELWTWTTERRNADDIITGVSVHVSPMAEDFHELFGLGTESSIAPMDVASVALTAAQDLHQMMMDRDIELITLREENRTLQTQINDLESRLAELEALIAEMTKSK